MDESTGKKVNALRKSISNNEDIFPQNTAEFIFDFKFNFLQINDYLGKKPQRNSTPSLKT